MILTLGNPQFGQTVQIDIDTDTMTTREIDKRIVASLRLLTASAHTARKFSLENETKDEKKARETIERNSELRVKMAEAENEKMTRLLRGDD